MREGGEGKALKRERVESVAGVIKRWSLLSCEGCERGESAVKGGRKKAEEERERG